MQVTLSPSNALFAANVNRIEQQLAEANRQISSGLKINVASDAPDEIDSLLQLRADRQRNAQIQSNLTLAGTDASAADGALSSAISLMDRAVELATQGANATQTADTRAVMAQEVATLQQQMVGYSQTQVQGRYIFSGDQDNTAYYRADLQPPPAPGSTPDFTALTGVQQLSNAAATTLIEDPAGGAFSASRTAQDIFCAANADGMPAADNVFAALNGLRVALLNNDQAGIASSIDALHQAAAHLNLMQGFYGAAENRIADAQSFAASYDTRLQTGISGKQDADTTAAALELTRANTQLQAAFQMQGKMPQHSLFDFLA